MKPSPLRLNWVTYPSASYELTDDQDPDTDSPVAADVSAEVKYNPTGEHYAFLRVTSRKEDAPRPYKFSVVAVASFEFDLEIAKREYRSLDAKGLVPMIAVNVSRILYAGVREYLAMITSRATFGAAVLDSTLLEPRDVSIDSDLEPPDLVKTLFGATDEEVSAFRASLSERQKRQALTDPSTADLGTPKKRAKKSTTKADPT